MPHKTPELLAPAGSLQTGLAALRSGADAVYAGLEKFNARERGVNFTRDDLARLIEAASKEGKKVYVTFNTLLKEDELGAAAEMLADLSQLRPDALIVQDLAVIRMVREYFPELSIHASTQMGIHNSLGVRMVAELGVSRVILERQLTLAEVREITRCSPIETEVFVHGALCCCLSGMCLLSSWMGGWSGNRGKCKQPCRRRYCGPEGNGFFFSPKDLYTLDLITDLSEAGVASLKIEGRLKPSQYVADTVQAYRLMLDTPPEERPGQLKEARRILAGALGRKWSHGFYDAAGHKDVIQHDSLGTAGRLVGKVKKRVQNGFVIECMHPVRQYDRLRIQPASGDEGPAVTANRLLRNGRPSKTLRRNEQGIVVCKGDIPAGGLVFKTGQASDTRRLADTGETPPPGLRIDVEVALDAKGLACRVTTPLFEAEWSRDVDMAPATRRPLSTEKLAEEFGKAPPEGIGVHTVTARCDGEWFLPFTQLRDLRREFWRWAAENVLPWRAGAGRSDRLKRLQNECRSPVLPPDAVQAETETVVFCDPGNEAPKGDISAKAVWDVDDAAQEAILPEFRVDEEIPQLRDAVERAIRLGCRRFRVTSLYGLQLLREFPEAEITAAFPLPAANSMAAKELRQQGVIKASAWVELDRENLVALAAKAKGFLEVVRYGYIPLLTTRAAIPVEREISDARGGGFFVVSDALLSRLYPLQPLEVPALPGVHEFRDHRRIVPGPGQRSSAFNLDREWQ